MVFLKSCPRCGGLHDIDSEQCPVSSRIKEPTEASRFRNTYRWRKKREEIRERDKHLCQVCIIDAFSTTRQYTFSNLEVNHIVPLEEMLLQGVDIYIAGLEDDNLLTLCVPHHKLADAGVIPRKLMLDLASPDRDYGLIGRRVKRGGYPPTSNASI